MVRSSLSDDERRERRRASSLKWYNANREDQRLRRLATKTVRVCGECGGEVGVEMRSDAQFCSERCMMRSLRRRWAREHPDKIRAAGAAYAARHPATLRAYARQWRVANPEANRLKALRYRARRVDAFVEDVDRLVVLELDDGVCGVCGRDVDPFDYHVDHIVPLALGGQHSYANSQVAHPRCNLRKWAKMPETVAV